MALIGGTIYVALEILWRGHSHWTMFLLGGICFVAIGLINEILPAATPLPLQMAIGAALVTAAELVVGLIINVWLGWGVWDYTDMPLNFMGQICLPYVVMWFGLSAVAVKLEDWLHLLFDRWGIKNGNRKLH